jgi:UDP-glucose 4-epimerase
MASAFPTAEGHHAYANRTLYGAAKNFGEGLLRSFNDMYGLDYVALRYFNVYGPRMDLHGRYTEVLIRWMERIAVGQPPIIFGDGTQSMDFVHVTDVARANLLAATSAATDTAINIGSATETTLVGLARGLAAAMGRPDLMPIFAPERSVNPVQRRLAATELARNELGFETQVPLQNGLRELVAWWQSARPSLAPAAE